MELPSFVDIPITNDFFLEAPNQPYVNHNKLLSTSQSMEKIQYMNQDNNNDEVLSMLRTKYRVMSRQSPLKSSLKIQLKSKDKISIDHDLHYLNNHI